MPKKLNGLPAPLTTNATMMTIMKTDPTMTATAVVMTKTTTMTVTIAKMTVIPGMTTAQIAREADKAAVTRLITPSTPSTPMPSAPMTLTSASYWTAHALSTRMPSTPCESAEA